MEDYELRYGGAPEKEHGTYVTKLRYSMEFHSRPISIERPRIWERLQNVNAIRNTIAHSGGLFRHSRRQAGLLRIIKTDDYLQIDEQGYLVIAPEYVFRVCEWITVYFNLLLSAAGYSMNIPEQAATALAKSFEGFENEIARGMDNYYRDRGI